MTTSNVLLKDWVLDSEEKKKYIKKLNTLGIISMNYSNSGSSFFVQKCNPTILKDAKNFGKFLSKEAKNLDFCEILRIDQSRLFFDIDIKTVEENTLNSLEKLTKIIQSIAHSTNTIIKGVIECKNEEWLKLDYLNYEGVITVLTTVDKAKDISGHLYLTGKYYERSDIESFLKEVKKNYFKNDDMFDTSVYKTTQQAFRHPYSQKKADNRPINELLYNNPRFLEGIDFVCAPSVRDIKGDSADFDLCMKSIETLGYSKYEEPKITSKITPKLKKIEEQKKEDEEIIDETTEASIFSVVHSTANDCDMELFFTGDKLNHFDLVQDLCFFQTSPLTLEEFKKEILLIKPDLKLDKFFKKFTYKQDYTALSKLTYLKKLHYKYIDDRKKLCKEEGEEIDQETKEDISKCYAAIEKIDLYYLKYWKEDFIRHNFISFENSIGKQTKTQFLFYNCFKLIDENTIYQVNPDTTLIRYKNITSLANKFRLSGTTAQRLYQNMVVFDNVREFKLMVLDSKYQSEPVDDLLDMLKNTFVYESDYKYYLSWLANKITYQRTNGRGIISQPETDGGCDSLKTYMTSLLGHFIEVYNADLRNLNKSLNGTYFRGLLTVVEELPRNIKDIENIITILKSYTQLPILTVEEKGEKPIQIENRTDIIMNTNFNVEKLFYLKADALALSKRFRILTRKSIDVKKYSNVLDKYSEKDIDHSNAYQFYRYLYNNEELINYYKDHKKEQSEMEIQYQNLSLEVSDTDKIATNQTLEEFVEHFKQNYADKNKNIKINKLLKLFNDNRMFTNMKQKSFKRILILKKCVHMSSDNRTFINDEEIKNIYTNFFTYEEDAELDLENEIL